MHLKFIDTIEALGEQQWNPIAGIDYPFLRYEFLHALESSGATSAATGWQPCHLVAYNDHQPIALIPLFIKDHSYGEYMFDWSWADAYHRTGLPYYPKLISAIPFTPTTGARICFAQSLTQASRNELTNLLTQAIKKHAMDMGASSWHCLFPETAVSQQLKNLGFCRRQACQFHWINKGYANFSDFLASFNSRKRKNLRKEREKIVQQGITLTRVEGADISPEDWRQFYQFYRLTYLKRSGHEGYLDSNFFNAIGDQMNDSLMMVQAHSDDQLVAAALFFKSSSHLYGRYWGCLADFDGLHFEACYYQGIEYAIEHGLQCFDPGAQGEHKIQRGFTPTATWSNHWMAEPQFHAAVADFTEREIPSIEAYMRDAAALLPFKQS